MSRLPTYKTIDEFYAERPERRSASETARRLIEHNRRAVAERLMVLTVAMNGSLNARRP